MKKTSVEKVLPAYDPNYNSDQTLMEFNRETKRWERNTRATQSHQAQRSDNQSHQAQRTDNQTASKKCQEILVTQSKPLYPPTRMIQTITF